VSSFVLHKELCMVPVAKGWEQLQSTPHHSLMGIAARESIQRAKLGTKKTVSWAGRCMSFNAGHVYWQGL
jgi:hypothetical protein